jgi:hypothetical protein
MESFRTRGGQCRITDEAIHIDDSYIGRIKRHYDESRLLTLSWLIFPLCILYFFVVGDRNVYALGLGLGIGLAVGGGYLAFGYTYNYVRDFTYDDRIPRNAIKTVKPVSGTKGVSRPRFIVKYERDGERKNRYIQMPSKFGYGDEEFEKAKELFRSEDIPVETA